MNFHQRGGQAELEDGKLGLYRPVIAATGETEAGGAQVQGTLENLLSEKLKRRLGAWSGMESFLECPGKAWGRGQGGAPPEIPPVRTLEARSGLEPT